MHKSKSLFTLGLLLCGILGTAFLALAFSRITAQSKPFLITSSPMGTYTVHVTGQKDRPHFFTNEVRFDVLKNGKPFVSDEYLHSGDAFDLSFESGYPDYRWLADNILHFYRKQNLNESKPDAWIVVNRTDRVIKYLRVYATDKFLLFDLQGHSETKLLASPSRGDFDGLSVKGEFSEGRRFESGAGFMIRKELSGPFTYEVYITNDGLTIECPQLEKYKVTEN